MAVSAPIPSRRGHAEASAAGGRETTPFHAWDRVPMYEAVPETRIDGYEEDLVPINWILVADDVGPPFRE